MKHILLFLASFVLGVATYGQGYSLSCYIKAAKQYSPLLHDYRNQLQIEQAELRRLKALYTRSRLELNGDYLFVPVLTKDGGQTSFRWNAQDATDYYGYDLGESSGHLHAGAIDALLKRQTSLVRQLARNGLARQSDLYLLAIEREANDELRLSSQQSYHTHLMDLNLLCGIDDTTDVALADVGLHPGLPLDRGSLFTEQYRLDSLNTAASLRSFNLQYKPRLDLFVDGGMQTGSFSQWYRHFGWSAGLTFTWTLFDGRQKRWKERQAELQQQSIRTYRDHAEYQRSMRLRQCLSELEKYDRRDKALTKQLTGYERVLSDYAREVEAGQVSVLDYLTVLRNKIQTERDALLMRTNRQLVIAAYNYWNH